MGAAACVAYAAHVASGLGGASVAVILLALALGGAVVACAVAALERSPARNAWRLLALALAAYGLTSITYTVVPNAASNFPSVYDLGLFAFYPLVFAALIAFVRRRVIGFSAALWIDSIVGAVVVAALGATVIWPLLDGPLDLAVVGQLLFFLGDLGFLGFLLAAYALSGWRDASSLGFLAGGAALLAIADGVWVVDVAGGAAAPGLLPSFLWPAAVLVLAIAPYGQVRAVALSTSTWSTVGIPGASAVACLPIVLLSATDTPQHILGSAALGLVVVRLTISLRDNFRMFATIEEAAITDPLTGLANRKLLLERLDQSLSRQSRLGGMTAVLSLDLDDFKAINDAHGHEFGDEVLVAVGERLAISLRHYDSIARGAATNPRPLQRETIGRLDGDEFVVLLEGLRDPTDAAGVAERILTELLTPLVTGTHEVSLEASTGIAIADDTVARAGSEVLRDADTAMYAAKRAGKGHYEFFEPRMHDAVVARTKLIRDLDGAVENSQLRLLYQPQVDLSSGRMTGVEALVRWQHPQRGLLSPDLFIPAAESTGMIVAIDDWVMREACTQLRAWDDGGVG